MNANSHLVDFYKQHKMSPVFQDIDGRVREHFEKRESLYRQLGIVSHFIQDRRVIEFGPGNGQNPLYTLSLRPRKFTIVDANESSLESTKQILTVDAIGTELELINSYIEKFESQERYDLVLCENVLPIQRRSKQLLKKISQFVEVGGVLVITCTDSVSFLSDNLRQIAARVLTRNVFDFDSKLELLRKAFKNHLKHVSGTFRSFDDWVTDLCIKEVPLDAEMLSMSDAIAVLGEQYDFYSSTPKFIQDWRWFKNICGEEKKFNENAIQSYYKNVHNLINFSEITPERSLEDNVKLLKLADRVFDASKKFNTLEGSDSIFEICENLREIKSILSDLSPSTASYIGAFLEAIEGRDHGELNCDGFAPFYGRVSQYVSFVRVR